MLLRCDRDELPSVVAQVVAASKSGSAPETWKRQPTPISAVGGRLLVGAVPDMPSDLPRTLPDSERKMSYVVISAKSGLSGEGNDSDAPRPEYILRLQMAEGKKDQILFLQSIVPEATRYIKERLSKGDCVCVCCDSGKDASVGVVLAALQLFFDECGVLVVNDSGSSSPGNAS